MVWMSLKMGDWPTWGAPCFQIKPKSAEAHGGSMRQQSIQMVDHSFCYQLFRLLLLPKRNVLSVNRSAASTFFLFPYPTSFTMDMITGSSVLTTGFCLSSWSNWSTVCISKASGWRYRSCFLASQFRREEEGEEGQRSQKLRETKRLLNANHIYIYVYIHIQEDLRWSNQFLTIFHDVSAVFFFGMLEAPSRQRNRCPQLLGQPHARTTPTAHVWTVTRPGLSWEISTGRGVGMFNGHKFWDFLEKPDQLTWYNLIWYFG